MKHWVEVTRSRLAYWADEKAKLDIQYGKLSRIADRAACMIGSIHLLTAAISEHGIPRTEQQGSELFKTLRESREFCLWPFYEHRCKEIHQIITAIVALPELATDDIRAAILAKKPTLTTIL